jgi:hypothetical protein
MNYENPLIDKICGNKPDYVVIVDPGNNPNFVFTPDPNFTTLSLYDVEGNTVNVNSWLECANYVNGGWFDDISSLVNYERITFFILGSISFVYIFGKFAYRKIKSESY